MWLQNRTCLWGFFRVESDYAKHQQDNPGISLETRQNPYDCIACEHVLPVFYLTGAHLHVHKLMGGGVMADVLHPLPALF